MPLSNKAQAGYIVYHHILPEGLHSLEITTVVEGVYGQQQTPTWVLHLTPTFVTTEVTLLLPAERNR